MIASTAIALQVNGKNKTQHKTETKPVSQSPRSPRLQLFLPFLQRKRQQQQTEVWGVPRDEGALQSQAPLQDGSAILYTSPPLETASIAGTVYYVTN